MTREVEEFRCARAALNGQSKSQRSGDLAISPTTRTRSAQGIARHVGQRQVLDIDDGDAVPVGAGADRLLDRFGAGQRDRLLAGLVAEDAVDLAAHLRDRGAHGIGDGGMRHFTTSLMPGSASGIRKAPPPTAISGVGRASSFMRSTASATIACRVPTVRRTKADRGRKRASGHRYRPGPRPPRCPSRSARRRRTPRAFSRIRKPTLCGPTVPVAGSTMLATAPGRSTARRACGNWSARRRSARCCWLRWESRGAGSRHPVVVPPTSTTIASSMCDRKAAPRILLVGPDEKL